MYRQLDCGNIGALVGATSSKLELSVRRLNRKAFHLSRYVLYNKVL